MLDHERPVYFARTLTAADRVRLLAELATARSADPAGQVDSLVRVLDELIASWRNVTTPKGTPIAFDAKLLPDRMSIFDLWTLALSALEAAEAVERRAALDEPPQIARAR